MQMEKSKALGSQRPSLVPRASVAEPLPFSRLPAAWSVRSGGGDGTLSGMRLEETRFGEGDQH